MKISNKSILLLIILFACILRLLDLMNVSAIEMDGISYAGMAENFARGAFSEGLKGVFHPLYPMLMAVFSFVIKDSEMNGRILSLVFGIMLIPVVYMFFKRFFGEQKALYGSFFVAMHPYLVRYSVQVISESMTILLFAAAFFCFYRGWKENDKISIGFSGLFLALTYLNKTEYFIYTLPFCMLLAKEKRYSHACIFFACFILFAFPYIYYLRIDTGLWVITKKVCVAENVINNEIVGYAYTPPFTSFLQLLKRSPFVIFNFIEAVFPPLFFLAVFGFKRVEPSYRILTVILVVLHICTRVLFSPHSTKRYSVEFIPMVMVFAVEGISVIKEFFERYRYKNLFYFSSVIFIIAACIFQGITYANVGRGFHKEAGVFLLKNDPGRKIVSRLPLVPFYSKGEFIDITTLAKVKDCTQLTGFMNKTGAKYLIYDDRMVGNPLFKDNCLSKFKPIKKISCNDEFVIILRIND
jgi:4-amino-4-deoxy-L-arabinose transferase-like glycosyltransferase